MTSNYEVKLRGFLDTLLEIEDRKVALREEAKELMKEASEEGYSPKILRKLIARRKRVRDELLEEERMIEDYEMRAGL